jgi:hypothetical protein
MRQSGGRRRAVSMLAAGAAVMLVGAGCSRGFTQPTIPGPAPAPAGGDHGSSGEMDHGSGGGDSHGGSGGGGHSAGGAHAIPARLNHAPTAEQRAKAMKLVEDNKRANAVRFRTTAQARAAGYIDIGDGMSGVTHFEHPRNRRDGRELDVMYPEALVYKTSTQTLQTVMYILEPGKDMDDVVDIAGNLTVWHGHNNLCWKSTNPDLPGYLKLGGAAIGNRCTGGTLRIEPPMLHVWVTENPCGPFAGTDPGNRTGSCGH